MQTFIAVCTRLSQEATEAFESSRIIIKNFINALGKNEIIFTRGTTESVNLVASSYGRTNIKEGDEIIISTMEHHSNIVPWQMLCAEKNAKLRIIPINDEGELIFEEFEKMINEKTKFVSIVYASNSLGTVNPVKKIIDLAHSYNIPVMLDAAQAVNHLKIDVQKLDCDFLSIFRTQTLRTNWNRNSLWKSKSFRSNASLSRRRRYDFQSYF